MTTDRGRMLPDDDTREQWPLYSGCLEYFPAALAEVARWSKVGGAKYNNDQLRWVREMSTNHQDKILRHLLDYDQEEENGFIEAVPLAWRALALLQTELEKRGWAEGRNARKDSAFDLQLKLENEGAPVAPAAR